VTNDTETGDALVVTKASWKGEDAAMKKMLSILGITVIAACSGKQAPVAQEQAKPAAPKMALPAAIQEALPPAATAPAQQAAAADNPRLVTGKIAETMDSGGYTYLKLATATGDRWAAIRQSPVKKGSTVTVAAQMVAQDFESKTLNRKFDQIIFGAIADQAPMASAMATPAASPMTSTASEHMKTPVVGDVKVEKAKDGKTVAEIWAAKTALQDKPVTVRGKVVKFLPEIMGKNWLHLRDGSGSRDKGDDDITVTTNDSVKVGDVVTVTGTLRVDKDFGAGYRYPVIIEDAKLQKE
jgi:hypothetical protein